MLWIKRGAGLQWAFRKQQSVSDLVTCLWKKDRLLFKLSLWFLYKSDGGGQETTQQAGAAAEGLEEPHFLLL